MHYKLKYFFRDRTYTHDLPIYLKRIAYALIGKEYQCMDCFTWSLDYSIMKQLERGLRFYILKHTSIHVTNPQDIEELKELQALCESYSKDGSDMEVDWNLFNSDHKAYRKEVEAKRNRLNTLFKKHFRSLWI